VNILLYCLLIFFLGFLIQVAVWRARLPKKNHTIILLGIFFSAFFAVFFLVRINLDTTYFGKITGENFFQYLSLALFYGSLTLAYIASYSAVEVDSPSLSIILEVAEAKADGLEKRRLYSQMDNEHLVIPRLKDLVNDKMVYLDRDKYKLTRKGEFLIGIIVCFRKLLNAPKGG